MIQWAKWPGLMSHVGIDNNDDPSVGYINSGTQVSYPISFSVKCISVIGVGDHITGIGVSTPVYETNTGFTFACRNSSGATYGGPKYYLAIGY
jgi:hypothetical protein